MAGALAALTGSAGFYIYSIGFWAAVLASLIGVWQTMPSVFADCYSLLRRLSPAQREATTQPGACHNSKQSGSRLFALFPGSEGLARRGNPRSLGADFFTPRFTP